jgi:hypothetical protein
MNDPSYDALEPIQGVANNTGMCRKNRTFPAYSKLSHTHKGQVMHKSLCGSSHQLKEWVRNEEPTYRIQV